MIYKLSLLLVAGVTVCACASDIKPVRQCPQTAIVRALEKAEDHGHDAAEDSRLVGVALMQKTEGSCVYENDGVDVNFKLTMLGERGAALGGSRLSFPYFVSLVSPEDKVLGKELMTAEFVFPEGAKILPLEQDVHVRIPLAKDEDASFYRVLTGFQLTEAQLKALQGSESGQK